MTNVQDANSTATAESRESSKDAAQNNASQISTARQKRSHQNATNAMERTRNRQ